MIHEKIKGQNRLCFLVIKGTAANIVVPVDNLAPIDFKRFQDMEAQGGELMRTMRDTTLDNGLNALVTYQDLLVTVAKTETVKEDVKPVTAEVKPVTEEVKPKRGRGRPRKNK